MMKKLVVDSTALMELPQLPQGELYAPPGVFEESRSLKAQLGTKEVTLKEPSNESMEKVERMVEKTGDSLSLTDKQAVALALDLKAVLVSDDYGCQNVASFLSVEFKPLSKPGIRNRVIWKFKCQNCGAWLKSEECPVCGQKGEKSAFKEEKIS